MANVNLIEFTGKGRPDETYHAADLLIYSKSTRLHMTPGLFDRIKSMNETEKRVELEYMAGTIPSSWEMVDVMFLIEDVSRATAQQITRTRTGSYAMQSQRAVDVRDAGYHNPFDPDTSGWAQFEKAATDAMHHYVTMVDNGDSKENARGILPLNTRCNLVAKYNLRAFVDLIRARSSLRVQGEYSDIADQMKARVLDVWPWAAPFFEDTNAKAIKMLEQVANDIGLEVGNGHAWQIAKAIDLLRK